jgi:hypothetical protein
MEVSFAWLLMNNSRFLEQKIGDYATNGIVFEVEFNVHVFAKS